MGGDCVLRGERRVQGAPAGGALLFGPGDALATSLALFAWWGSVVAAEGGGGPVDNTLCKVRGNGEWYVGHMLQQSGCSLQLSVVVSCLAVEAAWDAMRAFRGRLPGCRCLAIFATHQIHLLEGPWTRW